MSWIGKRWRRRCRNVDEARERLRPSEVDFDSPSRFGRARPRRPSPSMSSIIHGMPVKVSELGLARTPRLRLRATIRWYRESGKSCKAPVVTKVEVAVTIDIGKPQRVVLWALPGPELHPREPIGTRELLPPCVGIRRAGDEGAGYDVHEAIVIDISHGEQPVWSRSVLASRDWPSGRSRPVGH